MDFGIYAGDTDKTIYLRLRDATTGLAKTGLAYNSAGAVCSYTLPLAARAAISLATQTVTGAHSDGGFVEVDATNCKGLYRLDLPDAAIASGSFTVISIEFDGIIEESIEIPLHTRRVNVTQIGSSTQSATDLKDFADTGYDPSTHKVAGVVLVDTTTTNTDMRGTNNALLAASAPANFSDLSITETTGLVSVSDKTGFSLASNGLAAVATWTVDITGSLSGSVGSVSGAVGSVTGNVGGNVAGSVGSIDGVTFPTNFEDLAITDTTGRVTVGTNADKTGYSISGTITSLDLLYTSIYAARDDFKATGFSTHSASDVWEVGTRVLTANTNLSIPTAGGIADAVWTEILADHSGVSGSTAAGLAAASSAGDPWATTLPGSYTSGQAGKIVGDNLNATVSSRSSHSAADVWTSGTRVLTAGDNIVLAKGTGVTGFTDIDAAGVRTAVGMSTANLDTQLTAISTPVTNNLDATVSSRLATASYTTPPTANTIADATLSRAIENVEDTADKHSLALLVAMATNSSASGTSLTVNKPSDDSTWFSYTLTVDAGADPVTGVE